MARPGPPGGGGNVVRVVATLAIGLGVLAGCGDDSPPEVAATVAGQSIDATDVETLADRYTVEGQDTGLPRDEARRLVLDYLIRFAVLDDLADEAGIEVESEVIDAAVAAASTDDFAAAGLAPGDVTQALLAGETSRQLAAIEFPDIAVAQSEVEDRYESDRQRFAAGWTAVAWAAYFEDAADAETFADSGAAPEDFDAVATANGSAQAGRMGSVTNQAQLPEAVLDVLATAEPGELTAPIEATGGWLVFLVESREEVPSIGPIAARAVLEQEIADARRQQLFEEWFDEQVRAAAVEVDGFYGHWDATRGRVTE